MLLNKSDVVKSLGTSDDDEVIKLFSTYFSDILDVMVLRELHLVRHKLRKYQKRLVKLNIYFALDGKYVGLTQIILGPHGWNIHKLAQPKTSTVSTQNLTEGGK